MRFAHRTQWQAHTNTLTLAQEALQAQGIAVADLTESNPTHIGIDYPVDLLKDLTDPKALSYDPQSLGLLKAREAVAAYYQQKGVKVDAGNILMTASTSEAYSFLLRLLVNPGEKVLIPRPSYPLFQFLLEINDVAFDYYPLSYAGCWRLDHAALENLIDDKTRAIIIVNPNNPTGQYLNSDDLVFLNKLAVKHQLALISDEVFFDYPLEAGDMRSLSDNQGALSFTLSGLSKVCALPQMKAGWLIASGPQAQVEEAMARLEIIADTYLSVNTPVQYALGPWLNHRLSIQGQIMARVKANREFLTKHCDPHAQILHTQGGWYAILKLPAVRSEEEWVLSFLKEDHVLVHPGYFFDFEKGVHVVISLLPQTDIFQKAIIKIMDRISRS